MPIASFLGEGWVQAGAYAVWYCLGDKQNQDLALISLEGQAGVAVFAVLGKAIFTATRPGTDGQERRWFTGNFNNSSFPSGHTMSAFCAATTWEMLGTAAGRPILWLPW